MISLDLFSNFKKVRQRYPAFALGMALLLPFDALFSQTADPCQLQQFSSVSVSADFNIDGPGENIDTIDFWEAELGTNTLMFVTAKDNNLIEVWQHPFENNQLTPITHSTFTGNVNGVVVDQEADLLYVSIGEPASTVSVFSIPQFDFVMNFNKPGVVLDNEPNLTLLRLPNGDKRIFVSSEDDVYIHDATSGAFLGEFRPERGLETLAADSFYQALYIPDEKDRTGIYAYHPDGTPFLRNGTNRFGEGVFQSDAEGIWLYTCADGNGQDNGAGLILVSDQLDSQAEFEIFDRQTWDYLGALLIDGVSGTDGICSFQVPMPGYPLGLFAAIDSDSTTAAVGWDDILAAIGPTVGINPAADRPTSFELQPNYPNPFNPSTTIRYRLISSGPVNLSIFDSAGQTVRTLVNSAQASGSYAIDWDGRDEQGFPVASGIYLYRLNRDGQNQVRRMLLVR